MHQELLPLFPLQLVLLPNAQLPLHIFEDRYKQMIGEVIRTKSEFGIVLASEKGLVNTGCTAMVDRVVKQYDDGRMDIVAEGRRRFVIESLNQDKEYLRGRVHYFDDEESTAAPADLRFKVEALFEELKKLEHGESEQSSAPDHQFSFRVAQIIPDLNVRQVLLATRSEAERLRRLAEYLPSFMDKMRISTHMRTVAPSNGHGKHIDL